MKIHFRVFEKSCSQTNQQVNKANQEKHIPSLAEIRRWNVDLIMNVCVTRLSSVLTSAEHFCANWHQNQTVMFASLLAGEWMEKRTKLFSLVRFSIHSPVSKLANMIVWFWCQLAQVIHGATAWTGWPLVWKTWECQEFDSCQGIVGDFTKNEGIVREKCCKGKAAYNCLL